MNTATYRKQAQEHEDKLEWGHAADAWQAAIDYLSPKAAHSELYQADIKRMEERRNTCLNRVAASFTRQIFPAPSGYIDTIYSTRLTAKR